MRIKASFIWNILKNDDCKFVSSGMKNYKASPVKLIGVCAIIFPVGNPDIITLYGLNDSQVYGLPETGFERCNTSAIDI